MYLVTNILAHKILARMGINMKEKHFKTGYTQGVFDMFHIGHLNLLKRAKEQCDFLVVGVNSDALVKKYKNKYPVVEENNRAEIVRAIKYVDRCEIADTLDKVKQWEQYKFDAIFIGSDWKGDSRWLETERQLKKLNSKVVYLEYTAGVSSSLLRNKDGLSEDIQDEYKS